MPSAPRRNPIYYTQTYWDEPAQVYRNFGSEQPSPLVSEPMGEPGEWGDAFLRLHFIAVRETAKRIRPEVWWELCIIRQPKWEVIVAEVERRQLQV